MRANLSTLYHRLPKVNLNQISNVCSTYRTTSKSESVNVVTRSILKNNGKLRNTSQNCSSAKRFFSTNSLLYGTAARPDVAGGLSKQQADELILRLTSEERALLLSALQEYQSKIVKDEYLGQLAASRWRSRFGRPSKLPSLGDVDPTGSYCPVPEDWLKKRCVETVTPPNTKELIGITTANSIPFIGFGFLDNFIMIIAGDYIDLILGSYLCISTMAAAALGNTFSDVMGIGSAYYVERLANYIGYQPPKLTPIQLDMPVTRQFANLGRVLGVTIGCLLGMFPLLFISKKENKKEKVVS